MAQPDFEIGNPEQPKGHALLYFRSNSDFQSVFATYVVVPPITFDLSKYVPPAIASSIPPIDPESMQFVPLPPIPEAVESLQYLRKLAEARGDDLVYGGTINPAQMEATLLAMSDICREYAARCKDYLATTTSATEELDVNAVLFSMMGERDKLGELARLLGKLRYALDGNDQRQVAETVHEIEVLGKYLPDKYKVSALIRATQRPGEKGGRLAQLYLERCYRLSSEDYREIEQIDRRIEALESEV